MNPTTPQQAAGAAPANDIRKVAIELYTPPFRHEHGYIRDANEQVIADDGALGEMKGLIAARIRGWGRIQYMDNPEGRAAKLQDAVGEIVADALNAWWGTDSGAAPADPMDWPLPCAVTVGHGTMGKGVPLRTLVLRMKVLYEMATGHNADEMANRTRGQNTALAGAFRSACNPAAPDTVPAASGHVNAIADIIFDHQRLTEQMPPLDREGFRELIGAAIDADRAARQPIAPAPLTDAERAQLAAAVADFVDVGETDVPYETLMRFAALGLLECDHFQVLPAAHEAVEEKPGIGQERSTS